MSRGQTHGGKGDKQRPTDKKKYEDNYDAIFGKKKTGREEPCGSELLQREKEKKEKLAILNSRMRTPDGTILESIHRHDYVTHTDANGKEYMLDGGCDYVRCSANGDEEMLTIYTDYPHEVIRLHAKWGTYGKEGDEPLKYVAIADLNPYHLRAILDTQKATMRPAIYKVMQDELEYRNEN